MHWRHKGSHLHNNDASLVSRSAHVLCWQCALALSLSVRGPRRASPVVWLAGFAPLAACLAMTHVAVFRLTPNAAGRPSVTSYAYGLFLAKYLNTRNIDWWSSSYFNGYTITTVTVALFCPTLAKGSKWQRWHSCKRAKCVRSFPLTSME